MAATKQPEEQREHQAKDNACSQRKIKDAIFSPINDVTGEPSDGEVEPAGKEQESAGDCNAPTYDHQDLAQVSHRSILSLEIGRAPSEEGIITLDSRIKDSPVKCIQQRVK